MGFWGWLAAIVVGIVVLKLLVERALYSPDKLEQQERRIAMLQGELDAHHSLESTEQERINEMIRKGME